MKKFSLLPLLLLLSSCSPPVPKQYSVDLSKKIELTVIVGKYTKYTCMNAGGMWLQGETSNYYSMFNGCTFDNVSVK